VRTPVRERSWSDGVLEAGFGDPVVAELVGWPARVARMVEVEAALGLALARTGLIPADAGEAVARRCAEPALDLDALAAAAATAPTPAIPLLRALREGADDLAAGWLHHGATSQDVVDTATVLQLRAALDVLERRAVALGDRCAELAERHRHTVIAGRTLGQQAVPVTFGLKAARWLGAFDRRIEQLRWVRPRVLTVQLGGVAGTSAVYGEQGLAVADALADELGLAVPDLPWHAERDRIVELAGALAALVTTVEGVATDLVLHAQTEVGEVREARGEGPSSSAVLHKRNPAHAVAARAASRLATGELGVLIGAAGGHEHERAAGAWQAEWVALPSALVRTAGASARLEAALTGLEVDSDRAWEHLDGHLGLTASEALATALTPPLGRPRAQTLVGELAAAAIERRRPLREIAADHPEVRDHLDPEALTTALDPATSLRLVTSLIDRALATHQRIYEAEAGA
jgi:3-carboxy-cis,cis-muconate cycloisomerase